MDKTVGQKKVDKTGSPYYVVEIIFIEFLKELSNRLKKQITEDEYKNRILLVCFERQLRYSKIGKLVLKDEFKYYKLLEEHCRRKMHLFPYHLQVNSRIQNRPVPG